MHILMLEVCSARFELNADSFQNLLIFLNVLFILETW